MKAAGTYVRPSQSWRRQRMVDPDDYSHPDSDVCIGP
jgi:hypothetical protein